LNVRLIADMLEERWPSMDLFADMLVEYLPRASPGITVEVFRLPLRRRIGRLLGSRNVTADRLMGRHFDYPRELRRRGNDADINHIVDQSYAAAASSLPRGRTVVTCHDLDTFAPLTTRSRSIAGLALRELAKVTLQGLRTAERVVCVSETVKRDLVERDWIRADRISVIPGGTHPSCAPSADPEADAAIERLLGPSRGPEILHVGSTISRKRIDTLLGALAGVRKSRPDVRLLRVGGPFTRGQQAIVSRLGLAESIVVVPFQTRASLAALYRRSSLVVMPSESEGFGLPIVEAMACGTPVLASDLDVFHEVGGDAIAYAPIGEPQAWARAILALLDEREAPGSEWRERVKRGLGRSSLFSWPEHTRRLRNLYETLPK
jgi:glycosyltransferase involved in cell wall biosynthesis